MSFRSYFLLDPFLGVRKFTAFGTAEPDTARADAFVALEDWLNDGAPLTANVARTCLRDWYGANAPARGDWSVGGVAVAPQHFSKPAYFQTRLYSSACERPHRAARIRPGDCP